MTVGTSPFETGFLLMAWGVVSAAGSHLQVFFQSGDLDRVVATVGVEVGGLVGNVVLAAQFVFNGGERVRDVFHLVREKSAAASGGSEVIENFVAAQNQAAIVGGDGINQNFSALPHFNALSARVFALIVFTVPENVNRLANGVGEWSARQL